MFSLNSYRTIFVKIWEGWERFHGSNFRKIRYSRFGEKCLLTDILTYWQWWFYRIPFHLKARVQKSTLELQQSLRYISFKNPPWACLGMPDHAHLKSHGQFLALIDMKLHAQNQLYTFISHWDIKVLKDSLGMPGHTWPHPPKLTWLIYNFNRYEADAQNQLYTSFSFWDLEVLIDSLGMPGHDTPHSRKITSSICSSNRYALATLYLR